ncbi:MAG TPA: GNAT family N-acetyltransferase [Clostridiaceae bacterium]|nr:GNAT family N-acetyltransferase [Clostridiaceae bacterium]
MKITFRECVMDDLVTLRELSCKTYSDTFGPMNILSNMKAYIEKAYNLEKLRNELSNNNSKFYFLYADEKLSGYLKLNEYKAQTDIYDPQSLEIERIYVLKEFQGKGLGSFLIKKAIAIANTRKKSYIWLGVWERNQKAILFYKKYGFYVIGKHSFFMGEEEQTDFIMRKDLMFSI